MTLNASLAVAGDEAFLPRLALRFPRDVHYVKVVDNVSGRADRAPRPSSDSRWWI